LSSADFDTVGVFCLSVFFPHANKEKVKMISDIVELNINFQINGAILDIRDFNYNG